jgi:hypothetical protein
MTNYAFLEKGHLTKKRVRDFFPEMWWVRGTVWETDFSIWLQTHEQAHAKREFYETEGTYVSNQVRIHACHLTLKHYIKYLLKCYRQIFNKVQ